jgi:hypothetical protein
MLRSVRRDKLTFWDSNPTDPLARRLARAKLRITQKQFVRVRLARRLVALLHDEERPALRLSSNGDHSGPPA